MEARKKIFIIAFDNKNILIWKQWFHEKDDCVYELLKDEERTMLSQKRISYKTTMQFPSEMIYWNIFYYLFIWYNSGSASCTCHDRPRSHINETLSASFNRENMASRMINKKKESRHPGLLTNNLNIKLIICNIRFAFGEF